MPTKRARLIVKIKNAIVLRLSNSGELPKINFSNYLSNELNYDYTYLANIFSDSEGYTIEQFILTNKIETVKALIRLNNLSLTQIANKLHYSSLAHLSNQFKKITGFTPSFFKRINLKTSL